MSELNIRQAIIVGVTLGLVAALVVWYLERFESNRLFSEMREYMQQHDSFNEWLKRRDEA